MSTFNRFQLRTVYCQLGGVFLSALALGACTGGGDTSSSSVTETSSSQIVASSSQVAVSSSSSASSEPPIANYDHCTDGGFKPHTTNGSITDGPYRFDAPNGMADATVNPAVYDYMYDNAWQDAHVLWHNVRACGALFGETPRPDLPDACDEILFRPEQTTCQGNQDGLEFLAGHRLMLEQLKELWPDHQEQFSGWDRFPMSANDYPEVIRNYVRPWGQDVLAAAEIGDNIENYLHLFDSEGALGTWLQCGAFNTSNAALRANLHIALHGNGSPGMNQPHAVNNNNQNLDSYLFWKLHGWIDNVWERYRIAKGKTKNDADYKAEMLNQCQEMDHWRAISLASRDPNGSDDPNNPGTGLPRESGYFHEVVRPAIENAGCLNCHGDIQVNNSLQLGGNITSSEIVENLLGDAVLVRNYKYVVPGNLNASWLYLKSSGGSNSVGAQCSTGLSCIDQMPNGNAILPQLQEWIVNRNAEKPQMIF